MSVHRFSFDPSYRLAALPFGVTPRTAYVEVADARLRVRFGPYEHGYGHTSEQVDAVTIDDSSLLAGYHAQVHQATLAYLDRVDAEELDRIVDRRWDPPVTAGVRLVSVIGDCLQHLGQAAYARGLD